MLKITAEEILKCLQNGSLGLVFKEATKFELQLTDNTALKIRKTGSARIESVYLKYRLKVVSLIYFFSFLKIYTSTLLSLRSLKVHKREKFFVSDFEFFTIL